MIENILNTFDNNTLRLNNLISLYKKLSTGKGRKSINSLDILRATIVLTHSTLEDYLRSLLNWKLPLQGKEKINHIPLVGTSEMGRPAKFTLGELVIHREKIVDDVIHSSVSEYLDAISFNNTSDIASALGSISLEVTQKIRDTFPILNNMIKRRHNIVHRADKNDKVGSGHHVIKSISVQKTEMWRRDVDKLIFEISENFDTKR